MEKGEASGIKSEPRGWVSLEIGGLELVSHWLIVGVRRTEELAFAGRRTTTSRFYSWRCGRSDIFRATISTVRFRAFLPTGRGLRPGRRINEDTGEDDPFPPWLFATRCVRHPVIDVVWVNRNSWPPLPNFRLFNFFDQFFLKLILSLRVKT